MANNTMTFTTTTLGTYTFPFFPKCNQVRKPQQRPIALTATGTGAKVTDFGFYSGGTHLGLKGTLYELQWPMMAAAFFDALDGYVRSNEKITWDAGGRARRGTTTEKYTVRIMGGLKCDPDHRLADYRRNVRLTLNVRDVV